MNRIMERPMTVAENENASLASNALGETLALAIAP